MPDPPPYGYVPIPTDETGTPRSVLDNPVLHDGGQSQDLLSGELRCTLTALTPLLAGNDQVEARKVRDATLLGDGTVELPESWNIPCPVAADKTVIEPLRDARGRVLVSGAAIKGMMSTSIGALLAAPMARVEERTVSYRPNLKFPNPGTTLRRAPRPAIVESWDEPSQRLSLRILPARAMQSVVFVQDKAARRLPNCTPGAVQNAVVSDVNLGGPRPRLTFAQGSTANLHDYLYFSYFGGNDTDGVFAQAFNGGRVYGHVLVPDADVPAPGGPDYLVLDIDPAVLAHHVETNRHLSDRRFGHLRGEHPLTGKMNVGDAARAINGSLENVRKPGTLIYCEVDLDAAGNPEKVVSFGQNYRYRWRYKDTVRTRWTKSGPVERGVVAPHPEERRLRGASGDKHRPPAKLSGVRLLTGYAVDGENPGTTGIGTGDFEQLAGRIAINMAVEQDAERNPSERFMSANSDYAIPIKVLGAPRASAEMTRLNQADLRKRGDRGKYVSYGETLDDFAGELGGYVFYRHQPPAQRRNFWRGSHTPDGNPDLANIASNQSSIARFVLKPRQQLRVKIRFRDLRPWELGAILASLRPGLAEDAAGPLAEPAQLSPAHAVKLGYGRPIGLGSVRVDIDHVLTLKTLLEGGEDVPDGKKVAQEAVAAFLEKTAGLDDSVRAAWLDLHRYDGAGTASYPEVDGEIYEYFTQRRRAHSKARRER